MDKTTPKFNKVRNWVRIIHRDLGFLMVGICLVYAISGIILNHMGGKDPSVSTREGQVQFQSQLNDGDLIHTWNDQDNYPTAKKAFNIDQEHTRLMLEGGVAVYNNNTGIAVYEIYKKRPFVYWINKLHYNKVKGWNVMADLFAGSLIFFALSGLVMVRGKNGVLNRGKWYLLVGLLIPIAYVFFS